MYVWNKTPDELKDDNSLINQYLTNVGNSVVIKYEIDYSLVHLRAAVSTLNAFISFNISCVFILVIRFINRS